MGQIETREMTDPQQMHAEARTDTARARARHRHAIHRAWLVGLAVALGGVLWLTLDLLEPVSGTGKLVASAGVAVCCAALLLARGLMPKGRLMDAFFSLTCMVVVTAIVTHVLVRYKV